MSIIRYHNPIFCLYTHIDTHESIYLPTYTNLYMLSFSVLSSYLISLLHHYCAIIIIIIMALLNESSWPLVLIDLLAVSTCTHIIHITLHPSITHSHTSLPQALPLPLSLTSFHLACGANTVKVNRVFSKGRAVITLRLCKAKRGPRTRYSNS